jgi:uncharacterized membrane protein
MNMKKLVMKFSVLTLSITIFSFLLIQTSLKINAADTTSFVVIGDSNTTPWLSGTTSWFKKLENKVKALYPTKIYQFTNLAVNGKSVTPTFEGSTSMQYDINQALGSITETDIGLIMLGTNDAWRGQSVSDFQTYYKSMISTIKNSGKINQLYILAVPPEISPYNCIGTTCWRNSHNPQTERVVPFNTFLSTIPAYCTSIGFSCTYINSSNGISLSTTYLNAGDGIHLLNPAQEIVATNVFNVVKANTAVTQVENNFASFVSQDASTEVLTGSSSSVRVTMKNTGLTTWTAASGYKLNATVNGNNWGTTVNLDPSDSIAPGQQKDFVFNITAPKIAGQYKFEWRMMRNTAYFGDPSATININVFESRNATFVSQNVPTNILVGKSTEVSLTIQNSGTITWSGDEQYGLGIANTTNWGITRIYLAPGELIAPGESKTFTFNITAPTTVGNYYFKWRMLQENGIWFGANTPNTLIIVSPPTNNASFVSQNVPSTTMVAGRTQEVSITMTNNGTKDWKTSTNHKLGAVGNGWGMTRVPLNIDEVIEPGEERTFTFTIKAPTTPGTYNFQYRMVQEGVSWFGAKSVLIPIKVIPQTNNASFVSQNVPTSLAPGETAQVTITMLNNGTKDWKSITYHKLGIISTNIWGIRRVALPTGEVIAPGQEKTFTFNIKAPTTPGTYNFQWKMIQEGVQWFGLPSDAVMIVVE